MSCLLPSPESHVTATPATCAYCGAAISSEQTVLDVESLRCAQCQLRTSLAITNGADEQLISLGRQALIKKSKRVRIRVIFEFVTSVPFAGYLGYAATLPNISLRWLIFHGILVLGWLLELGVTFAAHRRIKNALKQMELPSASVVAE